MTLIQIIAVLVTLAALFSYLNFRFIKLPTTIGVMLIALVLSLALLGLGRLGWSGIEQGAKSLLEHVDFDQALMQGMLSFMLFAGALHINLQELKEEKWAIGVLAVVGVVLSMFLFGTAIYGVCHALGVPQSYAWCLLFGALISPTDPIAVLGILKGAGVPKSLQVRIAGESLFNDGIGVVVFLVMQEIAIGGKEVSAGHIALLFLQEAVGGVALGLLLGWVTFRLLKSVDNYQLEVLLTLALVVGGYALADSLHTSGLIAMVVAGLLIGNHGRQFAMSQTTRGHIDDFWELVDELLNVLLFLLIGLEMLVLTFGGKLLLVGMVAVPALLVARWVSIVLPFSFISTCRNFQRGTIKVMTWGGLRGGISVALALSLPFGKERDLILAVTYILVVFSILVQGLTMRRVVKKAMHLQPGQ